MEDSYTLNDVAKACGGTVEEVKAIVTNDGWAKNNPTEVRYMKKQGIKPLCSRERNKDNYQYYLRFTGELLAEVIEDIKNGKEDGFTKEDLAGIMFSYSQNKGVLESFKTTKSFIDSPDDADKAFLTHLAYLHSTGAIENSGYADAVYQFIRDRSGQSISSKDEINRDLINKKYHEHFRQIFDLRESQPKFVSDGMNMDLNRYYAYSAVSGGSRKRKNRRSISRKSNRNYRRRSYQRRNNRY